MARMPSRFCGPVLVAALTLGVAFAGASSAQGTVPGLVQSPVQPKGEWVHPPADPPKVRHGERRVDLDTLFAALKIAPDEDSAKAIEERIWAMLLVSKSDTANLLMTRVKAAVDIQDLDLAIKLLDSIIAIRPDYVEAWNRRATLYFMKKDFGHALSDIAQVLAREPRHFGALAGLGLIMQELGDDKEALAVYRRVIDIYPHMQRIPDLVKTLTEKVDGRNI